MNSPKALEPFEIELIQEHIDLKSLIEKHESRLSECATLSESERVRIQTQIMFMEGYEKILNARLAVIFRDKKLD